MIRSRNALRLFLSLSLVFLIGCATMRPLTQKQQVSIWQNTCVMEYHNVEATFKNKNATLPQLMMANQKKNILIQIWPKLTLYSNILNNGGWPSEEDKQELGKLIDQLTSMVLGGG